MHVEPGCQVGVTFGARVGGALRCGLKIEIHLEWCVNMLQFRNAFFSEDRFLRERE